MYDKGDIYKGSYEGMYCTPCESFWTPSQLVDGKCPDCGTTAVFEEDELLDGAPKCPNCGKPLDFEVTEE